MTKIPDQVKKSQEFLQQIRKDRTDLVMPQTKQKTSRFWWVVLVSLLLIIAALIGYIVLTKPAQKIIFWQLMPHETVFFSVINQSSLYNQLSPFQSSLRNNLGYYNFLTDRIKEYLQTENLSLEQDILPLFEDQLSVALFANNENSSLPFLIIIKKKAASVQINRILEQLKNQFKKDFYFQDDLYRQNNVTSLKSIIHPDLLIHISSSKDYLVISNSQIISEKTLDLLIDN